MGMKRRVRWQRWLGRAPKMAADNNRRYAIGEVSPAGEYRHGVVRVRRARVCAVWARDSGRLVLGVDGAEALELVPNRAQAVLVRVELEGDAEYSGTSRGDYQWFFERYDLLTGDRLSSMKLESFGWLVAITFSKRERGTIARVRCGDETGGYSIWVELLETGDREVLSPAERKHGPKAKTAKEEAENVFTTLERLAELAELSDALAASVAANPVADAELLSKLALHPSASVRRQVAGHGRADLETQLLLLKDPERDVRCALVGVRQPYDPNTKRFGPRPRRSLELLAILATDADLLVRKRLASKQHIPEEIERALAADRDAGVRRALAASRITMPTDLIDALASDRSALVRAAAARLQRRENPEDR